MLHILLVFTTLSRRYHPTLSLRTMFRLPVSHFLHWPRPHFLTNHTVLLGHPTRKITLQNVSRKSCKNSEVFIYPERGHCHLGMKGRPTLILTSLPVFCANTNLISQGSDPASLSSFHHPPSSLSWTWACLRWCQSKAWVIGFTRSALQSRQNWWFRFNLLAAVWQTCWTREKSCLPLKTTTHQRQLNKFMNQIWNSGVPLVMLAGMHPS